MAIGNWRLATRVNKNMAKISVKRRQFEIKKRKKRSKKLAKLRGTYSLAKTKSAKEKILDKAKKAAPYLSEEEFLNFSKKNGGITSRPAAEVARC